jgi:hypothetical protein
MREPVTIGRMLLRAGAWVCALGLATQVARADPPEGLVASRAATAPVIDGALNDIAWTSASSDSSFTQKSPVDGGAPVDPTRIMVVYDSEFVYVGVHCAQSVPVVAQLTYRDRPVESDFVELVLDTRNSGKAAYSFTLTAGGGRIDGVYFDDTSFTTDWDGNWQARAELVPDGWTAEFRIPLRILAFDVNKPTWRLQVRRRVSVRGEIDEWSYIPRTTAGEVSHYRPITLPELASSSPPIELTPFVLSRLSVRTRGAGMPREMDLGASAGLDMTWLLSPRLTLYGTVNPDFAQVEADQVVLNLTTVETFFPEKRPFFFQGIGTFSTPLGLLYTRRIGATPPQPAVLSDPPPGETIVEPPAPQTIYGAFKLTGDAGDLSIGALSAVAGEETLDVRQVDNTVVDRSAVPTTLYNIVRLRHGVGANADVGVFASATNRFESTEAYPKPSDGSGALCPIGKTVASGSRCSHDSYVGAADFRWRSNSGAYVLNGQAAATRIENGPPRKQRDGTVIADGDSSAGGIVHVGKEGGAHWLWSLEYAAYGRHLDFNDLGFMARQNLHTATGVFDLRSLEDWAFLHYRLLHLKCSEQRNFDWLPIGRKCQAAIEVESKDFFTYYGEVFHRSDRFDDREFGDGTALERFQQTGLEFATFTDPRRRVALQIRLTGLRLPNDYYHFFLSSSLRLRPHPRLDFELVPSAFRVAGEPRYLGVELEPGRYLFGRQDAESLGIVARTTYSFTPTLSLQSYAQLFLAAERYPKFYQNATPPVDSRVRLADLSPAPAPAFATDSEQGIFNLNLVLRWEWRIGSTVQLLFSRTQDPANALEASETAGLNLRALGRAPTSNLFLIKLTYWAG